MPLTADSGNRIHDHVIPYLTALELRCRDQPTVPADFVACALSDIRLMLRQVQVDVLVDSGHARLIDVVQPGLTLADSCGLRIATRPAADVWPHPLAPTTARLLRRVVSTAIGNSVAAGASSVSLELTVANLVLTASITDDGPGFDASELPAGRGLERLVRDLGRDQLRISSGPEGTRIEATLPLAAAR